MICKSPRVSDSEPDFIRSITQANWERFRKDSQGYPLLSRAEEKRLLALAQGGDRKAINTLCMSNIRFVVQVSFKYLGLGLTQGELVNEGTLGLLTAVQRFDRTSSNHFITYAVWWIRQKMVQAIHEQSRLIRVAVNHNAALSKLKDYPLRQVVGGEIVEDLPQEVQQVPEVRLRASIGAVHGLRSLDNQDLEGAAESRPDTLAILANQKDVIARALHRLKPVERRLITLLYGLDTGVPISMRQAGELMGLSHERIRQIRNNALGKLEKILRAKGMG